MAIVISADEIKKTLPNYSPEKAEEFHHQSAQEADHLFAQALRESTCSTVILLNGGTASGKTEFMVTQLTSMDAIIFDGTTSTSEGARSKLHKIIRRHKVPVVYGVIPDDLGRAFLAFLNRDRKFSDEHFYKTHSGSRKTLLWIASEYSDVEINVIESSYTLEGKMQFTKLIFSQRSDLIDYLATLQMTEGDIIKTVTHLL